MKILKENMRETCQATHLDLAKTTAKTVSLKELNRKQTQGYSISCITFLFGVIFI